jgi:CO/xanthine dehydrogenase Mo-binding subunit
VTTTFPFEAETDSDELKSVGTGAVRIDGLDKISGAAEYVDDMDFGPGLLHAAIVESPHAYARIVSIDTTAAEAPKASSGS